MTLLKKIYLLLLLGVALSACDKETVVLPPVDLNLAYYPLEVGKYLTYAVDSIVYDPIVGGIAIDSVRLYVKEEVVDTFRDNTGILLYRVDRYERYSDTLPWQIAMVVAIGLENDKSAVRLENNLRFSKLVFPPIQGKRWEGVSNFDSYREFSVAGERLQIFRQVAFYIQEVDEPWELPGFAFDSVATVIATNFPDICSVYYRVMEERYAKHIGLVFREWVILDEEVTGTNNDTCVIAPWRQKAESGFVIRQTLIDHN